MANGEKLGMCDLSARFHENTPHPKIKTCVNWREQPQEPSRCPTCGSSDRLIRMTPNPWAEACRDPWHSEASEGGEKPQCPHDEIDGEGRCRDCREPATPALGAPTDKLWTRDEIIKELKDYGEHQAAAIFILKEAEDLLAASPRSGMGAREFRKTFQHPQNETGAWFQYVYDLMEAYAADQVRQATDVHLREVQELQNRVQYLRFGDPTRQSKGAESMSDGGPDNPASGGHSSECPSIPELQAKVAQLRQEAKAATNDLMRISKALNQPGTQLVPIADRAIEAIEKLRQERDALEHNLEIAVESGLKVQEARERAEQERDADEQTWRERCDAASKAGYEVAMEQERESRERAERALRDVEKQVTELVKIAAEVAHRRYLPDLEKARTIRNAREEVRRYDSYHMLLVARLKKVADSLRALAQVKSSEGEAK